MRATGQQSIRLARTAFTILEVVVAVLIAGLVFGLAAMNLRWVNQEGKIRRSVSLLETTARSAKREALVKQRAFPVRFRRNGFAGIGSDGAPNWARLPEGGRLEIRRWGETKWRDPGPGETWWFLPGMPCEPLSVRFTLPKSRYEMSFDPLTAVALKSESSVDP